MNNTTIADAARELLASIATQAVSKQYAQADDATHFAKRWLQDCSRETRERMLIERAIIRATVNDLIRAGYTVTVSYGEGDDPVECSADVNAIMAAIGECDEEMLYLYRTPTIADAESECAGWISLVYGNDGWDVVCDYTTNLEDDLKPSNELASSMGNLL